MPLSMILCVFGLMTYCTPAIMALMAGVRSDEDMVQWLMSQPIDFIQSFKAMQVSGYAFVIFGYGLSNTPYNPVF